MDWESVATMLTTIRSFLINVQFQMSIPIHLQLPMDDKHIRRAVETFPLLGLFQGMILTGILYFLMETPLSTVAVAFFLWIATIIISGGLYLDGWMDASDAFFSYKEPAKRVEIMADPHIGAFGVISLFVLLSSRFFFIYETVSLITRQTYVLVLLLPFFSKIVMGMLLIKLPTAKRTGLAYFFQKRVKKQSSYSYFISFFLVMVPILIFSKVMVIPVVLMIIVALFIYLILRKKLSSWFGGITGDLLGASVEGTELMLWMIIWLSHYFVTG